MAGRLKKWGRYTVIFLGILLMIPALLYLLLQIPAVQTLAVKKVTEKLSENFQSEISIGRVDYHFFNKIALSEILFKDINNDTLLFAENLSAGIRKISIREKDVRLGRINIKNPLFQVITDTAGQMNLAWYLKKLKSEPDSAGRPFKLSIDRIDIENAGFAYINHSASTKKEGKKVDFSNIDLSALNGIIENFRIDGDTTSLNLYRLAFNDQSGFKIKELDCNLKLSGNYILLESAYIRSDSSILNFDKIAVNATGPGGFKNFISDVKLDIRSEKSLISTSDLRYFVPVPEEIEESVTLTGRFTGTVAELRGRDIKITYRNNTILDCDFDISGLPEIDNSFIYLGISEFTTSVEDVEKLKLPGRTNFTLPEVLYRLGKLSFSGSFSGFTTDFVTYGEFRTGIGNVNTDISLRPDKAQKYRMQGLISGLNIDLGRISGSEILGQITVHANVDGFASSFENFAGSLKGRIDSIDIKDYNYRNIELTGSFTDKTWDGSINITDENIKLDLLGMFNFRDTLPKFDFTLNLAEADLHKLNIDKTDSTSALSLIMTSNFTGNNIDNLDGEIKLLSADLTKHGKEIKLKDFSIRAFIEDSKPVLSLNTDFLDAEINGSYSFSGLKKTFTTVLSSLMPSLAGEASEIKANGENNFTFNLNFKNTNRLNDFFETGLIVAENSYVRGAVLPDTAISIDGASDFIVIKNIRFDGIDLHAEADKSVLKTKINTASLQLPGSTTMKNFSVSINSAPDTIRMITEWNNNENVLNKGLISATGFLTKIEGIPAMKIDIDSSEVYANNNLWTINRSSVLLDSGSVRINDINIKSRDRFYHVNGAVSHNTTDTLHLAFMGIDISPLNHLTSKKTESKTEDSSRLNMNLRGRLNGNIALTNVYVKPVLEGDLRITDFSILGSEYGVISINSEFDYDRKVVNIGASNDLDGVRMFDAKGYYDPSDKRILLDILADELPVGALNPLLRSFASDISGFASGKLRLSGTTERLFLNGAVKAQNVNMRINYLQTLYTINDSIRFDNEGFRFNNTKFVDEDGKTAIMNGIIRHRNFREYTADLTINMGNDFKVLNTQLKNNSSFYGTVYASGVVKINVAPDLLSFDIAASTGKNTRFSIPLSDELSVSEYSFINFIDQSGESRQQVVSEPVKQLGFNINIDLEVTSDAVAEIIFDEKVGDKITGSGTGMLNINLNPKGDFKITGDYIIEEGDYLFTLGNILNKRFEVENGGTITFNGDLDNAEIDLRAIYQKFNTSLGPILQDPERNERVSVEPQLVLSGRLFNPTVKFEINLPDSDEETKTYLRNAIATDEELSRQFMYLLVMRSFYAEQASAQYSSSTAGTTAMAATTFEMVANQFSNWISQINDNFNLGINYQPGTGNRSLNPDELQLAFETQILDDRVVLNGNFDYRSTTSGSSTEQLTGDFEADVKLTEKVRFKVFNRFNDISLGKGPYTQGIGIFFKRDFEKFSDLFRKKSREPAKKEEEITLENKEPVVNK
ncbi:MAG TPA: translocation/assembly module TamB domain-containing protein [Bacteroidales bacterium]|nr:translocation/assembly module TamB domain-containing protein [Bacteroidales bacterium]